MVTFNHIGEIMKEATKQIQLVKENSQQKKQEIINKLLNFFERDVENTIQYIEDEDDPVPVDHVTPGRRIDLHPSREYLLRISRVLGELEALEEKMQEDEDLEGGLYG